MAQTQALPVVWSGRLVGVITERSVLARAALGEAGTATVGDVMERNPTCANIYMTVGQAADMMSSAGAEVLPVIDEFGAYRGVVVRSDVLASLLDIARPPVVAGMATPLGVRLTTGSITAGAGSLGLFLSGVALMAMMEAARGTMWLSALAADKLFNLNLAAKLASPPTTMFTRLDVIHYIFVPLQMLLMLLFLRLSPMASYHAAEHQVVHTIEAGEPLTPEIVARMPRAHPRCGTNLMAAAVLFLAVATVLGTPLSLLVAMVIVIFGWRTIGYYLQQYFTTKPAGRKHIQNGIRVGEELLARYRSQPGRQVDAWGRLWGMGLPQVLMGFAAVAAIDHYIFPRIGIIPWF